jgi:hypothetical protein
MLDDSSRWSHTPVNRVVPYHWLATPAPHVVPIEANIQR